jgi:uncharacterized membrane protein
MSGRIKGGSHLRLPHLLTQTIGCKMRTSYRIIAYVFSIIGLLLLAVDTSFQWRTVQERSTKYLLVKIPFLVAICLCEVCLVFFIEHQMVNKGTAWSPALWALAGFSMLLSLSVEVRLSCYCG